MSPRSGSPRAVALVGPRAAGKSTVGRALAALLGWQFVDADERLAAAAGEPAAMFLQRAGEAAFRRLEEQVSAPLLEQARRQVVALGGGAVLSVVVRARLVRPELFVAFLFAPAEVLAARIEGDAAARPPLTALPLRREVELLLQQRLLRYRQVADATFDTCVQPPEDVARAIAVRLDA